MFKNVEYCCGKRSQVGPEKCMTSGVGWGGNYWKLTVCEWVKFAVEHKKYSKLQKWCHFFTGYKLLSQPG